MILRAENLVKNIKEKCSKGISVEVNQGEIVGLLGPALPEKQLLLYDCGLVQTKFGIYT
jgi:ABC-type lipopolysaccharide export system ATPase subunit